MKESSTSRLVEQIIELLKRRGELSSADIAKELGVSRRTVTAVLARL
ncbi:MAG: HTH domain-containing protein, partial [Pyrobaculum sp.]